MTRAGVPAVILSTARYGDSMTEQTPNARSPRTLMLAGRRLPAVGQGTWNMGDAAGRRRAEVDALRLGLDLGLAVIDTAEMYGSGRSEELVGEAIAGRRDEVFLTSKVLPSNASRRGTTAACEASLRRLGTDHLDLYLLHWSGSIPFAETVEALDALVDAGKVRAWGVSNMDPGELADFVSLVGQPDDTRLVTNQILYNLSRRGPELDLLPEHRRLGITTTAYSPIEQGRLFGGHGGRVLRDLAGDLHTTPATVALAWAIRDGNTLAIPKASSAEHVRANADALRLDLDDAVLGALDEAFPAPDGPVPLEML